MILSFVAIKHDVCCHCPMLNEDTRIDLFIAAFFDLYIFYHSKISIRYVSEKVPRNVMRLGEHHSHV